MRSIWSGEMSDRSTWPVVGLLTRTPSTSTCTWLELAPRICIVLSFPRLPARVIESPGTFRNASSTVA